MLATMSQEPSAADSTANDVAVQAASDAGLRHVSDSAPGLRREPAGEGFVYRKADGSAVDDEATLQRIRALAIPPAWTDDWICPHAGGHQQA
jgi:DNA topoisomerase-1